jgi:spore coat-associated protein N
MFKLLGILAVAGCIGGAAGGILFAKALRVGDAAADTGTVGIAFGRVNRLHVGAVGLAPGDRMERPFNLKKVGKAPVNVVTLTTTASITSALDSDPVNGLQLRIDKCPGRWAKIGRRVYACHGEIQSVVPWRPVVGTSVPLENIPELQLRNQKVHLLLTLMLPQTAPIALENQTSSLSYTFTAA